MPFAPRHAKRTPLRLMLIWLLAFVLPVQGMSVGVAAARGPAHLHRSIDATLVLTDFRRMPTHAQAPSPALKSWFDHAHAGATPQRHHHARGDASVVRTADDSASVAIEEGASAASSVAAFLALLPALPAWHAQAGTQGLTALPPAPSSTRYPARLERPPRAD